MKKEDVFISQGRRPWWHVVIAALCFTSGFACLYLMFTNHQSKSSRVGAFAFLVFFAFFHGTRFSVVQNYYFDFDRLKYKIEKSIGPIQYGSWKKFKNLEYVSVFLNSKDIYEINLWYNKTKRFNIAYSEFLDDALQGGKEIAKKLGIDLLDAASDPANSEWVDLPSEDSPSK